MKSKTPIGKGQIFEYQICNLFQNQGFLTRRAIPLQYGTERQNATDIDAFGIFFSMPFRSTRIICDVKNKARANPHERVFWAKGLGEFIKANEVYVALPTTSWEFIRFANRGKVRVITSEMVEQSLKNAYRYGQADETFYSDYYNRIYQVAKTDKKADETINLVRRLYLRENPYTTLNIILTIMEKDVSKQFSIASSLQKDVLEFWKYVCCELTVLFSVQLLLICTDLLGLPKYAREKQVIEKLSYGEMEPNKMREIIKSIEAYANEIIKSKISNSLFSQEKMIDFKPITAPSYADDIVGLIERAFNNPDIYTTLPQLLDFLLFEQGLKGKEFSDLPYREAFKYSLPDERLKAAKNIIVFLRDRIGVDWKIIWADMNTPTNKDNGEKKEGLSIKSEKEQQILFNLDK